MKKTLIAVLIFSVISSFFMVRFYLASVDIYQNYVNENTLIYLNSISDFENLPQWTTFKSLWHVIQIDYLVRFIFMIVIIWVIVKLIKKKETMIIPLYITLALSIGSFFFMILYFAASSDIYNEYINENMIQFINKITYLARIPDWASCPLEWTLTAIDFILRIIFMIFIYVILIKLILDTKIIPIRKNHPTQ